MDRSRTTTQPSANTNVQSRTSPTSPVTRTHDEFFLPGCDQYLLAQNPTPTYFCVPSYIFRDSDFYTIKSVPGGTPGNTITGAERAIIIDEATVDEMAIFLWVSLNPLIDDFSKATLSEWFTILRLAHLWKFTYIKGMALRYIKPKIEQEIPGLVERIIKYEGYGTPPDTLLPLYVELCKRNAPLDDSEWDLLESLPGKRLRRVVTVREKLANLRGSAGSQPSDVRIERNIAEALGLIERAAPASATSNATGPQAGGGSPTTGESNGGGAQSNRGTGSGSSNGTTTVTPDGTSGTILISYAGVLDVEPPIRKPQGIDPSMPTLVSLIVSMNLMFFWKLL